MVRIVVGRLSGLRYRSSPTASVDVRAQCEELTRASASKQELLSEDHFARCMIAHGASAEAGQAKNP
jgi:hypothetical protein